MTGNRKTRGLVLQLRDRLLLDELAVMRVADREQVKVASGFHSTTRTNARLLALTRAGLLRRFFLGSRKALYALSKKGAQIANVPFRGPRRRNEDVLVADFFIEHQLAINDVYCALKFGPVFEPGVRFLRWLSFDRSLSETNPLIPDGYVEFATPEGTLAAFFEVDLGHERGDVWIEKSKKYLQLAAFGNFEERFGPRRFLVLVLANSDRRMRELRKKAAEVTDLIFRFTTLKTVHSQGLFAPIWYRPKGEAATQLIEVQP
jgi:hypothetical protein